jgi:hypothetical protein
MDQIGRSGGPGIFQFGIVQIDGNRSSSPIRCPSDRSKPNTSATEDSNDILSGYAASRHRVETDRQRFDKTKVL